MQKLNQTALVVVDSRRTADRQVAEEAVFAALEHFGVPWNLYELGAPTVSSDFSDSETRDPMAPPGGREVVNRYVGDRALFILAHDGAGRMPEPMARVMAEAVLAGAGLVALDREVAAWPKPLRDLVDASDTTVQAESLLMADRANPFITVSHFPGEELPLRREVSLTPARAGKVTPFLVASNGTIATWTRQAGQGRIVVFGCGAGLFEESVCGHGQGITGLLWRSLVWAARKPFATRGIPPFLTARFDDCNGSYDAFGYVQTLNEVGIRPNLGLFIDELSEADWRAAGELHRRHAADFSMHAFRDDLLLHNPGWTACRPMDHKPCFERGAFLSFTMDHLTGEEFSDAEVARSFETMDRQFATHGLRHSRILNSHFAEVAFKALPRFLDRGVDIHVNNGVAGQLYGNQPVWRPRPFNMRSDDGRYPLVIDAAPDRSGAFCAGVGTPPQARAQMEVDILWNHTPFLRECERVDVEGAITRCVRNMEWALDAMAWGTLMCHEQRVACVPPEDWRRFVNGVVRHFRGSDVQFAGREEVGVATRRLFDSRLKRVWAEGEELTCELTGSTDGPSPLTVWMNEGEGCRRTVYEIEAINGYRRVEGLKTT